MSDAPSQTSTASAVREFLTTEAASGTVLVILAVIALIWVNGVTLRNVAPTDK